MLGSDLKQLASRRFQEQGYPHRKDEEWTYTNIKKFLEPLTSLLQPTVVDAPPRHSLCEWERDVLRLVFVDGVLAATDEGLSKLTRPGIEVMPLGHAHQALETLLEGGSFFEALCLSQLQEGVSLRVSPSHELYKIEVHHRSSQGRPVQFPVVALTIEENAQATFTEVFEGEGVGLESYQLPLTFIQLKERAKLTYNRLSLAHAERVHVGKTILLQAEESELQGFSLLAGNKLNRHGFEVKLTGPNTVTKLRGAFQGSASDHVDQYVSLLHDHESQMSEQLFKGVLTGDSSGSFQGKVVVTEKAQKTNASQLSKVLVLSPRAQANTKPQLEILADDVKCAHGSAIGQVNPSELFYLQSRGISEERARQMLCEAFLAEVWSSEGFSAEVRDRVSTLSRDFLS